MSILNTAATLFVDLRKRLSFKKKLKGDLEEAYVRKLITDEERWFLESRRADAKYDEFIGKKKAHSR